MTTQQEPRIMAPGKPKIGSRPQPSAPEPEETKGKGGGKGGGKSRLLAIIIGLLIVVILAGAYWFLMGPGAASAEESTDEAATEEVVEEEEEAESGGVQVVESISINLDNGHYLRLGLGLDLSEDAAAHGDIGEAKALDAAIALFSGQTIDDLADEEYRESLKEHLAETLEEIYHGEVIGVYYTDFVTQ